MHLATSWEGSDGNVRKLLKVHKVTTQFVTAITVLLCNSHTFFTETENTETLLGKKGGM